MELNFLLPRLNNPQIHQALQTLSENSKIKAFVMDFFCDAAFEVVTSLKISAYYFFTTSRNDLRSRRTDQSPKTGVGIGEGEIGGGGGGGRKEEEKK